MRKLTPHELELIAGAQTNTGHSSISTHSSPPVTVTANPSPTISSPPVNVSSYEGGTPVGVGGYESSGPVSHPVSSAPSGDTGTHCYTTRSSQDRVDEAWVNAREGGVYTHAYVPTNASGQVVDSSGVTDGAGVDFGAQNATTLTNDGVPQTIISEVSPYFGLHGTTAQTYLNAHPLTMTSADATTLSNDVQNHTIQNLASTYNAAEQTGQTFYELPAGAQTAITDLAYQYGTGTNLATRTPAFWHDVITGSWDDAVYELNHFGDAFPTRRGMEANLIQNDINSGAIPDDSSQGQCK